MRVLIFIVDPAKTIRAKVSQLGASAHVRNCEVNASYFTSLRIIGRVESVKSAKGFRVIQILLPHMYLLQMVCSIINEHIYQELTSREGQDIDRRTPNPFFGFSSSIQNR